MYYFVTSARPSSIVQACTQQYLLRTYLSVTAPFHIRPQHTFYGPRHEEKAIHTACRAMMAPPDFTDTAVFPDFADLPVSPSAGERPWWLVAEVKDDMTITKRR